MSQSPARDRAVEGLVHLGSSPSGIWSAPGRVNLIGEHTDYNAGLVMPFAIAERTFVAASPRSDQSIVVISTEEAGQPISWTVAEEAPRGLGWASYALGMAWMMRDQMSGGVTLSISSDVPVGAGLSSSAALEMAVGVALRDIWGTPHSDRDIAAMGTTAENEVVGAPTGTMDQLASILGRPDSAVVIDCDSGQAEIVPFNAVEAGCELVVADTGTRHSHATGGYGDRRRGCEESARMLGLPHLSALSVDQLPDALTRLPEHLHGLVRHVVTENERVRTVHSALMESDFETVGQALFDSHMSLSGDFAVSIDELDDTVAVAKKAGALGARMVGGGFGGSVLALGPRGFGERFQDELAALDWWVHSKSTNVRLVAPSAGAGRDE